MSFGPVCALMLVKDEADIIEPIVGHLLGEVDHVVVYDNGSTDGTREILARLDVEAHEDADPAYYQGPKMSRWARELGERGFEWVVPCDADEVWYVASGGRIADFLREMPDDVRVVRATLYDHVRTGLDPEDGNPIRRIGWRHLVGDGRGKVACRIRPDLVIDYGNHGASYSDGAVRTVGGLIVRHFPVRSHEQYARKVRAGAAAIACTDAPEDVCRHWRRRGAMSDEDLRAEVARLHHHDPRRNRRLVYDPAPPVGDPHAPGRRRAIARAQFRRGLVLREKPTGSLRNRLAIGTRLTSLFDWR